ncbi:MAG: glycoside hydrolase family 9 protein [Chitinophagaceae bacterium]
MKCLAIVCLFLSSVGWSQTTANAIRINQLGYYPGAPKIAILVTENAANDFTVVSAATNEAVFKGKLSVLLQSGNSSLKTQVADFSELNATGRFTINVDGLPASYPFTISNNANHAAAVAALKGYYFIRSSIPLDKKYAGKWARAAGHPDSIVLVHPSAASKERPAGTIISTPGGWYDAGDYNKYIVNSGITMGTLLSAYEDFPAYYDTLDTSIPESKDALPDILNEALYNLRWMMTMQDPYDGGVYNKCTNAAFDGMVMPGVTKLPRYVVRKGTAATLDFAAVMAQCSRIVKKFPAQFPGLADSCLLAAKTAWQWAVKNPELEYNQGVMNAQYDIKISTGGYGDHNFSDEWFWAAAELFVTTNDKSYYNQLLKGMNEPMSIPSWNNVRMPGFYTLLRNQQAMPAEMKTGIEQAKERLLQFADQLLSHRKENAFQTVMGQSRNDFNWGSNSNACNQGIALINAFLLTRNKKYIDGALTNLDYILGRNATGYCFITGMGIRSPMHPHHRPSVADGVEEPVPGLLAGGPNPGMQDKCHYDFTEPETAYSDSDCSYASNEIAINWNAPLVYLANAIEALQPDVRYSVRK